jgi:hypothetical protein
LEGSPFDSIQFDDTTKPKHISIKLREPYKLNSNGQEISNTSSIELDLFNDILDVKQLPP